jgi:hypothetical protein
MILNYRRVKLPERNLINNQAHEILIGQREQISTLPEGLEGISPQQSGLKNTFRIWALAGGRTMMAVLSPGNDTELNTWIDVTFIPEGFHPPVVEFAEMLWDKDISR